MPDALEGMLKENEEDEDEGKEDDGEELAVDEEIKIRRRCFHRTFLERIHFERYSLFEGTEIFLC